MELLDPVACQVSTQREQGNSDGACAYLQAVSSPEAEAQTTHCLEMMTAGGMSFTCVFLQLPRRLMDFTVFVLGGPGRTNY
jgi:hypothetical protein